MDAIQTMPRGEFCAALDKAARNEHAAHAEALDKATHILNCPRCQRRGDAECPLCHGTASIPATQEEWDKAQMAEAALNLREFGLDALKDVAEAVYLRSRLHQIITELERRAL